MAHAISRLEGEAFNQVGGKIGKEDSDGAYGDIGYASVEELLTTLKEVFGDPDPVGTAQHQLAALCKRNKDFSRNLAENIRLSDLIQMTDSSKIFTLRSGLSPGMKEEIRYRDKPEDMKGFVALLKQVDLKIRVNLADTTHRPHTPIAPQAPPPSPAAPPLDMPHMPPVGSLQWTFPREGRRSPPRREKRAEGKAAAFTAEG